MKTTRAHTCNVCGKPICSVVAFDDDGAILACSNGCDFETETETLTGVKEWLARKIEWIRHDPPIDQYDSYRRAGKLEILEELEDLLS